MSALSKLSIGLLFSGGYLSPELAKELTTTAEPAKTPPKPSSAKSVSCPSQTAVPCC